MGNNHCIHSEDFQTLSNSDSTPSEQQRKIKKKIVVK